MKLNVMVSRHAERVSGSHHFLHHAHHLRNLRPTIYQIANKTPLSAGRRLIKTARVFFITQLSQELNQLIEASMYVSDDVERAMLVLQVVPQRLAHNLRAIHFFRR